MEINLNPWQNKYFHGHHNVINQLDGIKGANSINNSLLFYGDYGLGKCTLAFRFANFLLSNHLGSFQEFKIVEDDIYNQISKLSTPNIHYIPDLDEKQNIIEIKIDTIRDLKNKLQTKTFNKTQRKKKFKWWLEFSTLFRQIISIYERWHHSKGCLLLHSQHLRRFARV